MGSDITVFLIFFLFLVIGLMGLIWYISQNQLKEDDKDEIIDNVEKRNMDVEAVLLTTETNLSSETQLGGLYYVGWLFAILAIILTCIGIFIIYINRPIVGGDAYNFIISATRGTAWICAGIVSCLFGLCCLVVGIFKASRKENR